MRNSCASAVSQGLNSYITKAGETRVPDTSPMVPNDWSHLPDKGKDTVSREQQLSEQSQDPDTIQLRIRAHPEEDDEVGE